MGATGDNLERWLFSSEKLSAPPSVRQGMTEQEELIHRQTAASLIRKIGLKLKESCKRPSGLCMDTAMVYMHRFYMFHTFQKYPAHVMAPCALFLAAKVEETPIKLEYVIKTAHMIKDPSAPPLNDKGFEELQRELIRNENLLLQTLGFDLIVVHPHTSVITFGDTVGITKCITKLAYELATNTLHFTKMCLKYKPSMVAAVCLHMAFKSFQLDLDISVDGKNWWTYLDPTLEIERIGEVRDEYVAIINQEKRKKGSFNKWLSINPQMVNGVDGHDGIIGSSKNITTHPVKSEK